MLVINQGYRKIFFYCYYIMANTEEISLMLVMSSDHKNKINCVYVCLRIYAFAHFILNWVETLLILANTSVKDFDIHFGTRIALANLGFL